MVKKQNCVIWSQTVSDIEEDLETRFDTSSYE